MVRVFRCHRFVSQNCISTDNEPTVMCSDGDRLFVAYDNYTVEVFNLNKDGCHKEMKFSAIGHILQMVCSHKGEFVATIEENVFKSTSSIQARSDLSLRVYTNLEAIAKGHPMKVRIAGQVKRAKTHGKGTATETDQLVVIEIPLKKPPTCVATYAQNIAIGIKHTVLIYACERIGKTSRDVRCILELEFAFKVRRLDFCEEFLMCSSGMECQIVRFNFDTSARSTVGPLSLNLASGSATMQSFFEHRALMLSSTQNGCPSICKQQEMFRDVNIIGKDCKNSDMNANSMCHMVKDSRCICEQHQLEPERSYVKVNGQVNVNDTGHSRNNNDIINAIKSRPPLVERQNPVAGCHSNPVPQKPESKLKETAGGGIELLGPVSGELHTCAVYVEFEGANAQSNKRNGILNRGVSTLLYKKLEQGSQPIHSIQLFPVFLSEGEDNLTSEAFYDNIFVSLRRGKLIGLFAIVSTPNFAHVYSLLDDCRLISSFPYANETLQVRLTGSHLFAMSQSRVDVYTARCLSRIIFDLEETGSEMQQTMPFVSKEPCLIGYHMFFDLTAICQSGDYVTLLSKSVSSSRSSENSWSIYVLQRPGVARLYMDMMEQAKEWEENHFLAIQTEKHEKSQLAGSLCLIQEANMFLRSVVYLQKWTEQKNELIMLLRKSSLDLAHIYEKHETDSHLAIPYHLMAGNSLTDILQNVRDSNVRISSQCCHAFLWYAKKFHDHLTSNDIIIELANFGITNGCLMTLNVNHNDFETVHHNCFAVKWTNSMEEKVVASLEPTGLNSVTNLVNTGLDTSESNSFPR